MVLDSSGNLYGTAVTGRCKRLWGAVRNYSVNLCRIDVNKEAPSRRGALCVSSEHRESFSLLFALALR